MYTKQQQGYGAEYLVVANLMLKGYEVFMPTNNSLAFDLLVIKNGKPLKVQVKSGAPNKQGKLRFDVRKPNKEFYKSTDYDILAVVNVLNGKIAYFSREFIGDRRGITVLDSYPKTLNGYIKGVVPIVFDDYEILP